MPTTKDKIIASLTVILVFLIVVFFASWLLQELILKSKEVPTATLPPDNIPTISSTPIVISKTLSLLGSKSYTPSQNVYKDSNIYDAESIRLALNGKFDMAEILVDGSVYDEGPHFISFNFSTFSGVFNGVRNSEKSLDITKTDERGGVFTKESGVKFGVDLLGETSFATSNTEFISSRQLTKSVRLWDYLRQPPPTVSRVLVAPFNKDGQYGGATISKINLRYSCHAGSSCGAALCQISDDTLLSKCILRNFGPDAEAIYKKSVGL